MIKIGENIPLNIEVTTESGESTTLEKYLQDYLVIYFYPEDDTPGCTQEACSFRDFNAEITKSGAKILGISSNTQKSHDKFKKKYSLNFELLSDEDHKLQEGFGVWDEKTLFGRTFIGTIRSTFVVDKKGTILASWADREEASEGKVVTERHGEDVLNKLKVLSQK